MKTFFQFCKRILSFFKPGQKNRHLEKNEQIHLYYFYKEVWLYVQSCRREEHWAIEIIDLTERVRPTWYPDREKLENLDRAYNCLMKSENDLSTIKVFVDAFKTDMTDFEFKDKKVQNLLLEISAPKHLPTILQ